MTIYEEIKIRNNPKSTALVFGGRKISYQELFDLADDFAGRLTSLHILPGDRVAAQIHGTPESVAILLGCSKIGVTVAMITERTSEKMLKMILEGTNSKIVFMMEKFFAQVAEYEIFDEIPNIVVLPAGDHRRVTDAGESRSNIKTWDAFMDGPIVQSGLLATDEDYVLNICYTSGTTGNPKGIVQTNQSCINLIRIYESNPWGWEEHSLFAAIFPFFLTSGQSFNLFLPLAVGIPVLIDPDFSLERFTENLFVYKPEVLLLTKFLWLSFMEKIPADADLSNIKITYAVGGKLTDVERQALNDFLHAHKSSAVIEAPYGLSETNSIIAANPYRNVFKPLPGIEIKLDEEGRIYVHTPCLMDGYFDNPEATQKVIVRDASGQTWFDTEDVGRWNEDGTFSILGRCLDLITRDGAKIFNYEINDELRNNPYVTESFTYAKDGIVRCFIAVERKAETEEAVLFKHAVEYHRQHTALPIMPDIWYLISEIPINDTCKVDFSQLAEIERAGGSQIHA